MEDHLPTATERGPSGAHGQRDLLQVFQKENLRSVVQTVFVHLFQKCVHMTAHVSDVEEGRVWILEDPGGVLEEVHNSAADHVKLDEDTNHPGESSGRLATLKR